MGRILDRRDGALHIHLGSGREPPTHHTGLRRLGGHQTKAVSRGRHLPAAGVSAKGSTAAAAVVKVKYMRSGRTAGYAAYMTKDKDDHQPSRVEGYAEYLVRDQDDHQARRAALFTREHEQVDLQRFIASSRGDPRAWTIILSPQDGNRLDMERYTRAFMQQVEQDLGTRLEWVAANHFNTDNPHSHILVRGRDAHGAEFRIERDYLSNGLRTRAQEIAGRHLELGLTRTLDRDLVHDRPISREEVRQRLQETIDKWREGHQRALDGRQRDHDVDRGMEM